MAPIVDELESGAITGESAILALERCWYESLLARAYREHRPLAEFVGVGHSEAIRQFRDLEHTKHRVNRMQVALAHWRQRPDGQAAGGQVGVLRKEFEKKTRHLPLRKLMERSGSAIQALKPVFMMSPLSVAAYLPPGHLGFDVVMFDEASQVKPVEALGALLRAPQAIVVGDSRQLPPTSFFEKQVAGLEEESEEEHLGDLESILSVLVAKGTPEKMLRWHYRSRHESLIAVSNREFYDNRLVIFPSPATGQVAEGLVYHYLPHGIYDAGRSRANRVEARAVAEAVVAHAQHWPKLSLGVAAFSVAQRDAILEEVELMRRQHPEHEHYFHAHPSEPFFVKNLENVQGDERDVMFISIGYGRDETGKVAMRFGPINSRGGERRLNVLMTRARRRCEVFTNLSADDINLNSAPGQGVRALKQFLQFAEKRSMLHEERARGEADSVFEDQVARALREGGYQVEQQIGVAGYFVDLAIVDPEHPGRYLLGIECDGASYHSALTVRDRDRLRQQVLENLGWSIHRIWSTDWFRNAPGEIARVEESLTSARSRRPRQEEDRSGTELVRDSQTEHATTSFLPMYDLRKWELRLDGFGLAEADPAQLGGIIASIVRTEGPVHVEEVMRRLVDGAGTRKGKQIEKRLQLSIEHALRRTHELTRRGDFLWPFPEPVSVLRFRGDLPRAQRKIGLIPPEELRQAVAYVVHAAHGMVPDEVPGRVLGLLGLPSHEENRLTVAQVAAAMARSGALVQAGDHWQLPR